MNDDTVPSLFTFVFGYGGFFVVSLILAMALHRVRRAAPIVADVVEDDGEYDD